MPSHAPDLYPDRLLPANPGCAGRGSASFLGQVKDLPNIPTGDHSV